MIIIVILIQNGEKLIIIYLFICLFIYLFICLFVYLFIYLLKLTNLQMHAYNQNNLAMTDVCHGNLHQLPIYNFKKNCQHKIF